MWYGWKRTLTMRICSKGVFCYYSELAAIMSLMELAAVFFTTVHGS